MPKRKVADISKAPAPKAAKPAPPELTEFQKELFDVLGDMILNGASGPNLIDVLFGAACHQFRRLTNCTDSEAEDHARSCVEAWEPRVKSSWPNRPDKPAADPKTATQFMRLNMRANLEDQFDLFLASATPEEVSCMKEILCTWTSVYTHNTEDVEMELLSAFETELNRNRRYVMVPPEHLHRVIDFIELLTKPTAA